MAGRFKGFCHFPCFQTLPPRRGVCNCIQTTILLGPPAEDRPGPFLKTVFIIYGQLYFSNMVNCISHIWSTVFLKYVQLYFSNMVNCISHMSRCTVIRTFLAKFPTAPKSYATIFFGVQRTLYWSN